MATLTATITATDETEFTNGSESGRRLRSPCVDE